MDVRVQSEDFDVGVEYQRLRRECPEAGAIVSFVGLVRELLGESSQRSSEFDRVIHLELEHYADMTEPLIQDVLERARQRFDISVARVIHRVGVLSAGDQIVLVVVAGAHRESCFLAAQFVMDYLKSTATIWKKEVTGKSAKWLGLKQSDSDAAKRWTSDEA